MTTKKQKAHQKYFFKTYLPVVFLATSVIFNITVLTIMPSHFSAVAVVLLLTSFFALFIVNNSMKLERARKGILFSFAYSLIYLLIILYWDNAGTSACSEFFGSYGSCLGSAQQVFIEIFATPIILLTATQPIFKKRF